VLSDKALANPAAYAAACAVHPCRRPASRPITVTKGRSPCRRTVAIRLDVAGDCWRPAIDPFVTVIDGWLVDDKDARASSAYRPPGLPRLVAEHDATLAEVTCRRYVARAGSNSARPTRGVDSRRHIWPVPTRRSTSGSSTPRSPESDQALDVRDAAVALGQAILLAASDMSDVADWEIGRIRARRPTATGWS